MKQSPGKDAGKPPWPGGMEDWYTLVAEKGLCGQTCQQFKSSVLTYYQQKARPFTWRQTISPYRVFVSEIMLQQTQTGRVAEKFTPFITAFPDFATLASAPFTDVIRLWKGLGYNRRAKYLQEAATIIMETCDGVLPDTPDQLLPLPGIGPATAASICVFAFNKPYAFIETNIRTVFIYFFYPEVSKIDDRHLLELVSKTIDQNNPREWYYALMDYGVMLKKTIGNLNRRSRHYQKQSRFAGSDRQIRGELLRLLLDNTSVPETKIGSMLNRQQQRCIRLIENLCREGLVERKEGRVQLAP